MGVDFWKTVCFIRYSLTKLYLKPIPSWKKIRVTGTWVLRCIGFGNKMSFDLKLTRIVHNLRTTKQLLLCYWHQEFPFHDEVSFRENMRTYVARKTIGFTQDIVNSVLEHCLCIRWKDGEVPSDRCFGHKILEERPISGTEAPAIVVLWNARMDSKHWKTY